MMEDEYRTDVSASEEVNDTIVAEDGSYRVVRPESGRSYTDAHFQPADDISDVPPRYYEPEPVRRREKKPAEASKKSGGARIAALALVCSLLGGMLGAGIATVAGSYGRSDKREAVVETTPAPTVQTVAGTAVSTVSEGNISASEV